VAATAGGGSGGGEDGSVASPPLAATAWLVANTILHAAEVCAG